ncbi:MAG: hypothetical protein KC413_24240 [Anaerolineales bacterium]|nr:hypothetical protein [Anaerolineales bacterium]
MNKQWLLLLAAVSVGVAITWLDQSPGWDDTGISAMLILLSSGLLGVISPKRPYLWALAVGLWIPVLGIIRQHNDGSLLALVIAFIGAYIGMAVRKLLFPLAGNA